MPKKVKANGKTFTFEDDVTNEQIGIAIDEYFAGVKKKVATQPTSPKKQLASPTQTQPTPTSSDTEETQPPVESDGLGGPPKMKTFTGFTPEEQQSLRAKPVPKISKSAELISNKIRLQNELSKTKVTPKNQDEISKKTDELSKINKEATDIFDQEKRGLGSKLVDKLATGSSQLGANIAAIPELIYETFAFPQNAIAKIFEIPSLETDSEKFKKEIGINNAVKDFYKGEVAALNEKSKLLDTQYKDGIYDSFKNGDIVGGFDQLTSSFAESLPSTMSIMIGGAYAKAAQILATSTMVFGAEKNERLKEENPEMSTNARLANSLGTGLAQAGTEVLGSGSIGAAARGLFEREGEKKAFSILKDGLTEYYKGVLKKSPITASIVGEGAEEWASKISENAIDVVTGAKPSNYNVFEGGADAFLGGVFGGAVFGSGLYGLKNTMNNSDVSAVKDNTKNIFNLQSQLENPNIPENIKIDINSKIYELIDKNQKTIDENLYKIESLPEDIKSKLNESVDLISSLTEKAKEINDSNEIDLKTKSILLEDLRNKAIEANDTKSKILSGEYISETKPEIITEEAKPTTEAISPETSSNYGNLTENKDGDFVFFHVGGKGYETIKKSSGGTTATSKEEAGALSKVGGVAMYYTKPGDTEKMVSGEAKYAVTIPKEKVYDANTDSNNYAAEAETRHEEENPGKAFDANSKLAYITKIAGENGYDMVVSEWMGKTRAQTTAELTPTDVQLKEGAKISKPFEEEYVDNTAKGYKSIVPESKESKLKTVYDAINAERSTQNNYDVLYKLSGKDLTNTPQKETTKLIEESDLSQEVKDMYAEALAYEPGIRRTEAPIETQISSHKKNGGSTFLANGENKAGSDASSVSIFTERSKIIDGEITEEDINDFKEANKDLFKGNEDILAIGTLYDSKSGKTYIDVSAVVPNEQAIKLGKQYNQKAVYNLKTNEEVDTGGTGEAIEGLKPEIDRINDIREILKPTAAKSKLAAFKAKYVDKPVYDRTKLNTQVENAKKSLSKLLPNVKFVVHDTRESFIGVAGKNGRGYYDPATKTIHINALEANARTVAHEVFHSVLLDKVKTDANARDLTKKMVSAIAKTLEGNPELKKNLDDFIKNYDENIQSEEKVAELFGYLADGYSGFDAPTKSVIKRAMDRLAKMFGLKPFTEGEIVDMLKTLSVKVATGEEIVSNDIKAISEGASSYISEPTNIERFSKTNEEAVIVGDHKLSFVKESDLIDIDALMKDITAKKQKVWFWVADQLGRGNYFDKVIDGEHYLDAGPSFALDPKNRDRNVIWATGKEEKEITKLIGRSDYVFIISGSAQKSKLFNKKVFNLFEKRIGDYASFKKEVLDSKPTKPMRDVLNAHNSWETLREDASVDNAKTKTIGTGRKKFLIALLDAMEKPKSKSYNTYQKRNAFVDVNDIRDGFYKDNNFNQNDIMLVLKPTKIGGKSEHSTYENDILGEVVGVPNIKVNAFDIMTPEVKNKYKKVLQITEQQQAVAPYGIGVKQIERFQESESYSDMKDIVKDMIDEGMSITDIKKTIGSELGTDQVSLAESAYNELTVKPTKTIVEPTNNTEAFRDKVKDIPESGKVSKYLSGETIERVEGEAPRNIQEIDIMPLVEAGTHGKETVAMAKEVYGDKYIEKTLEFLDTANLKAHEKALLYVSLENEMFDLVKDNPSLKKLQDLVRAKSQQFLRESSLAINMGRLRAIMKDGFNYESVTDKFLSSDQLTGKKEVEKAIQSNSDEIQKEYESIVSESDIEQLVLSGVEKQINEIYKKLPTARRVRADKAISALENIQKKLKGRAYDATIGLPIALIDSGITVIKNSIKAGVNIADAIELGINHIKEKYGKDWANEGMFRDDMTQGFKTEGITEKEIKAKELSDKEVVKQSLIEAGFGKEITVKKVKRNIFDWKKLAGEEGSVDKIKENVEKIIGEDAAKDLVDEYNNLRASIIEKSLNELERRNIPRKKVNLKTSAKKLAELYNYGLFEKESDTYDRLMNTALGMNELDQKSFNEAKNLAKSLSELFSQKDSEGNQLDQVYLKQAERTINKQIERLLSKVAWSESNGAYKATVIAKEFIGLAQRNALVSVGQAIENTTSGYISRAFKKIGFMFDNVDTKSLKESRNKLARMTFKDITLGNGLEFGDVTSPFITKSKTMDLIVNASDSRLYHALTSTALGKPFLESADSMHKAALAQGFFHYNLIKILRKKGYSKSEAKNYVSEQLTGQSFEDALVTAKQIIDKINENAGKKVISDSKESIYRFANDLVNEALVKGNKITLEELEASLKSAETVAGFELGHEPNNIISKPLNLFNSWVQTRTDRAVKDKKWNDAAALTAASIVTTNILNPYIGGGTNWTLLAAQKAGIPTLSTIYWNIKSRGSKLDLSTEEGMKNLEKDLKYQLLAKNANTRMFIGAAVTLAAFALASATGADDDLYDWLKKNPWANKYMKKINPPAVQFMLAQKNKKLGEFLGQQMNIKADAFDEGKKIQQALKNAASGKTQKALGGAGQLAGSRLSTPIIPWRVVRDVRDIYRGLNGLPEIKHEYKASGFASGYFQGGMIEQIGLRPEDVKDTSGGRQSSGSRSESGSRESSGNRTQSGSR